MEDKYLTSLQGEDYVGVQCYTKLILGPDGIVQDPEGETTDMGYLYWPQSVEYTVRRAAALTNAPIIVTENGIGTTDDTQQIATSARRSRVFARCSTTASTFGDTSNGPCS